MSRVFLMVLDGLGVGELPDAINYGDIGSNTLKSIINSNNFNIPNLTKLGLMNINDKVLNENELIGSYGKMNELSYDKDSVTGHQEMMGIVRKEPLPVYPNGFPDYIVKEIEEKTGYGVLCNKPYSGTEVIKDYGLEHIDTKKIIVYTSADSVLQIAAHEDIIPVKELYRICEIVRGIMTGKDAVNRIIARPFIGAYPNYTRTVNRNDYAFNPNYNVLNNLYDNGYDVIGVGKICSLFNGSGITTSYRAESNELAISALDHVIKADFNGLCFANLVDFDMVYGHRNDIDGYAKALSDFDSWLGSFMLKLKTDDIMIITADHGCDPKTESTDHSREYIPLLVYGEMVKLLNLGIRDSFSDIGKTIEHIFNLKSSLPGTSFYNDIRK